MRYKKEATIIKEYEGWTDFANEVIRWHQHFSKHYSYKTLSIVRQGHIIKIELQFLEDSTEEKLNENFDDITFKTIKNA